MLSAAVKQMDPMPDAYTTAAELVIALEQAPLHRHAGCWEHQIDEHWWLAFNGHADPVRCSHGVTVQSQHCYIEFDGWPAGDMSPAGGFIASGEIFTEVSFIQALQAALGRAMKS